MYWFCGGFDLGRVIGRLSMGRGVCDDGMTLGYCLFLYDGIVVW